MDVKSQLVIARDNSELYRMIQVFMQGTAFPKTIDTPAKAIAAWQVAASLGLPPMVTIQNLAFIHGSVAMWGQLPRALAERTKELTDLKLILFNSDQEEISLANKTLGHQVWGAAVQIQRLGRTRNEYFFSEVEAKEAGLLNKSGPWQQYRKVMYSRRAIGQAIKFEFADALMGVPVAEYEFNEAPDLVAPREARKSLNDVLDAEITVGTQAPARQEGNDETDMGQQEAQEI